VVAKAVIDLGRSRLFRAQFYLPPKAEVLYKSEAPKVRRLNPSGQLKK
jgi:hypothetical protein